MAEKTKRDYAQEAKVAVDPASRQQAQAEALAETLETQDKARREAGVVDAGEQTARAAHSAEGGGAWPDDVLRDRFLTPAPAGVVAYDPTANYTSHETSE